MLVSLAEGNLARHGAHVRLLAHHLGQDRGEAHLAQDRPRVRPHGHGAPRITSLTGLRLRSYTDLSSAGFDFGTIRARRFEVNVTGLPTRPCLNNRCVLSGAADARRPPALRCESGSRACSSRRSCTADGSRRGTRRSVTPPRRSSAARSASELPVATSSAATTATSAWRCAFSWSRTPNRGTPRARRSRPRGPWRRETVRAPVLPASDSSAPICCPTLAARLA